MGGVLIDCDKFVKLREWQNWTDDIEELERKWQETETVRLYERGEIGTKEFYEQIVSEFALNVSAARFIKEFRILPKGFYKGADIILKQLSKKYMTAVLSNTNEVHWNKLCDVDSVQKYFKRCYPSHLIHKIKPDTDAYAYVIKQLRVQPSSVAFFDDREENIEAAKKIGIDAYLSKGFESLCENLSELSLL